MFQLWKRLSISHPNQPPVDRNNAPRCLMLLPSPSYWLAAGDAYGRGYNPDEYTAYADWHSLQPFVLSGAVVKSEHRVKLDTPQESSIIEVDSDIGTNEFLQ